MIIPGHRGRTRPRGEARRTAGRQAGFTLLETLVALAVLAVVMSAIPRPLVQARTTLAESGDWLRARLAMDAVLGEQLRPGAALAAGLRRGEIDGMAWSARIEPSPLSVPSDNGWVLLTIAVEVAVPGGPTLRADTLRIGKSQ